MFSFLQADNSNTMLGLYIEGATPNSGMLPGGKKEKDLVKEGLPKWKEQVRAWIQGGMKCQ